MKTLNFNIRKSKFIFFDLLCALYIMHNVLPIVGLYMPSILFGVLTVAVFLGCIRRIEYLGTPNLIFILLPMFILTVISVYKYFISFDITGFINYIYTFLQTYTYGLIPLAFIVMKDRQRIYNLALFLLVCYAVTSVTTVIGCGIYSGASRELASLGQDDADYIKYTSLNIGGFTFIYGAILLLPAIRVLMANKKLNPVLGILLVAVIGLAVYSSEYTTALVFYLITAAVLLIPKISVKKILIFTALLAVICIFASTLFSSVLTRLIETDTSDTRVDKYKYVENILEGGDPEDVDEGGDRLALYEESLNAFINSKGLGCWNHDNVGGHSCIFDNMGVYGVLGIAVMIFTYVYYYKKLLKNIIFNKGGAYLLWGLILIILFALLNPKDNILYLIFVVPLIGSATYMATPVGNAILFETEE